MRDCPPPTVYVPWALFPSTPSILSSCFLSIHAWTTHPWSFFPWYGSALQLPTHASPLLYQQTQNTNSFHWIISSLCLLHLLDEYNVLSLPCIKVTWGPPMTGQSALFVTLITACWPPCHFLCSWFQRANPHRCCQICVFLEPQVFINSSLWSCICFSWGNLRLKTSGYRYEAIVLLWCISLDGFGWS